MFKRRKEINYDKLIKNVEREPGTLPTFLFGDDEKEKEDGKYPYPISKTLAIKIAEENYTLKEDFLKIINSNEISFVHFYDYTTDVIEKDGRKYWQIQANKGKYFWVELKRKHANHKERELNADDFRLLRCLIDVENGDYIYYPNVESYEERIVKYNTSKEIDLSEIFGIKHNNNFENEIIFPTLENKDSNL